MGEKIKKHYTIFLIITLIIRTNNTIPINIKNKIEVYFFPYLILDFNAKVIYYINVKTKDTLL